MSSARRARQQRETASRQRWVFLADPDDYGWAQLVEEGETVWDGIRNARAQNNLRACRVGDLVLIYHTSPDKALVGTARVTRAAAEDGPAAVRIAAVAALERRLPLAEIRQDAVLGATAFVRMPRVAVHPISPEEWDRVMELSGTDPGTAGDVDPAVAGGP